MLYLIRKDDCMFCFDMVIFSTGVKSENELLEASLSPYFSEAELKNNGFSVKYGYYKCHKCKKISPLPKAVQKADVMKWIFNGTSKKLSATKEFSESDALICPCCNALGTANLFDAGLFLSGNRTTLYINSGETELKALHFNHSTGKTVAENFVATSGRTDITQTDSPVDFSLLIFENSPVTEYFFKLFSEKFYHGKPAPRLYFVTLLQNLVLLNRFQGYDEPFYHAIPFINPSLELDEYFSENASILRTTDGATELFKTLNLPNHKAIKRLFFTHPELMFFSEQIKIMPFSNPDIIRSVYSSKNIFSILTGVKNYPVVTLCMESLIKKITEGWISEIVKNDFDRIITSTCESLLSGKDFSLHDAKITVRTRYSPYNTMLHRNPLNDTVTIDGYTFFELRSTIEYDIAANELNNCLSQGLYYKNTIVCVKKDDRYIAAIDASRGVVNEAYLKDNKEIETDPEFLNVYEKWKKLKDICEIDETDDDFLHFDDIVV